MMPINVEPIQVTFEFNPFAVVIALFIVFIIISIGCRKWNTLKS